MITDTVQRFTERRESRRPAGETIRASALDVVEATGADLAIAKAFVERHHYSGTYCAAQYVYLLYLRGELGGVAAFGPGASEAAHRAVWPTLSPRETTTLGRFVLVDSVPGNGESHFIGRCFAKLRGRVIGVESCADPVPRVDAAGVSVLPGHVGTIYQATNGRYVGRTNAKTLRLLPDGTVLSNRACGKLVRREVGWRYAAALLERWGADPLGDEDPKVWLRHWRPRLTRKLRHHGNHRYLWCLDERRARQVLTYGPIREYPKLDARSP